MTEPAPTPLVSVERQFETDLATGKTSVRMFVKMYFAARDSGLLREIPDELWKTLCVLATYMDEGGVCCPSQATLAQSLGISRPKANQRIQRLLGFRFQGHPVLSLSKVRRPTAQGGRWCNNVYRIHPIAGLGIFQNEAKGSKELREPSPVFREGNTGGEPVFPSRDTRQGNTNKSQVNNQNTHGVSDE